MSVGKPRSLVCTALNNLRSRGPEVGSVPTLGHPNRAVTRPIVERHVERIGCLGTKEVGRHPHSTNRGPDHRRGHVPDAKPLPPQAIPWTRSRERALSCGPANAKLAG